KKSSTRYPKFVNFRGNSQARTSDTEGAGKFGSHAASDLAFAMTTRGDTDANVEPTALVARFADGPHVAASGGAEQRLGDWLAELEQEQSADIGELLDRPFAKTIVLGIIEYSPYLFDLIRADAARLI